MIKRSIDYLKLLSKKFPTARAAGAEIINLEAICGLPKGTEYFFSDLHGEYESFGRLLRSSSGIIRAKIEETFGNLMTEEDQLSLANLIYYPKDILTEMKFKDKLTDEWVRVTINRLTEICRVVSSKYTRSKVRKKMPADYGYAIDELLHLDPNDFDKKLYYQEILNAIVEIGAGEEFITELCRLIQNLTIDSLHIIGDIFDRGPRADLVMEELMNFHDVDIQWGNHDISWMGAVCGNAACIANVLRIATSYNSFDVLEDGYGINLRPLSMFAASTYGADPCERFKPHLLDENEFDSVDPSLAARMCKAITIIQLKLEGQIIKRHPEYGLDNRLFLDKIDHEKGTVMIDGREWELQDRLFETVDPKDPYRLTPEEERLMDTLKASFSHSVLLNKHISFLYSNGSMYKICNGNLLYHGCIPMTEDGDFQSLEMKDGSFSGKALLDYLNERIRSAFFTDEREDPERKADDTDLMWYLWGGPLSPLFGKDKIATFEHVFLDVKGREENPGKETFNPYYEFSKKEECVDRILKEFGLPTEGSHIINGHVPVRVSSGETPVKANGKLFIIDGGLSKAYHGTTGIAGYTLIFNSHHLALAEHKPYVPGGENTPKIQEVERMKKRIRVKDTDIGRSLTAEIEDLKQLLSAYHSGVIKESR
ncbi:MAG: fructose-1,6-bisphosphatase [Lachnospiraceae bacterium]|nr:fructose-1,6-bisphosphatase [Lachnospiraceae bacterium]